MKEDDIFNIWKSHDQKLNQVLTLNRRIVYEVTRNKLNKNIDALRWPKSLMLVLGIPYTLILCFITWVAFSAEAYIMMFGFGVISLIMIGVIFGYIYHLVLIARINRSEDIIEVQMKIALLKISSFRIARLSILQIPFWSICWTSISGLMAAPILYGGINLILFLGLSYGAVKLYRNLSLDEPDTAIYKLFFSGSEWEPIVRASEILEQLKEYK